MLWSALDGFVERRVRRARAELGASWQNRNGQAASSMAPKALPPLSEDACRVCGREDDEEFLVLCDGCDRPFHTQCHVGCACCRQKPRNPFARKPAVPDGDWFCKFCAGHLPALEDGAKPVSAVYAWGDNEDGQLAMPETEDKAIWTPTRVHQLDAIGVLQIACTETTTFALCNDANVYSVGTGPCGQLGHQDVVHEKLVKFRKLEALMEEKRSKSEGRFSQLLAGKDFGVAVTTEGHVYTWGNGEYGQLGHQENKNKKAPKKISALRELEVPVDLAACGSDFVVMTTKEGDEEDQFNTQKPGVLISMGANAQGQLGDATAKNQWVPQFLNKDGPDLTPRDSMQIDDPAEFLLGRDIVAMSAGRAHSAVIVSGTPGIWTWGLGERGQLGHPKPAPPPGQSKFFRSHFRVMRPRFVQALENYVVKQVVCGGQHTLMLLQDGRVLGMGDNTYGQVGAPLAADMSSDEAIVELPTEITSLAGKVKHIGCGDEFSVVLSNSGEVYTWGRGQLGQLGLGENTQGPIATPTKVEGLPTITKVFVGLNQVFAVEFTNETLPPPLPANTIKKRGPRPGKAAGGAKRSKK